MLIVEINVQFHLFQEVTNQFTAVIVLDKTNHKILEMTDIQEMTEVQDTLEMTEVQDTLEMTEVQDILEMTEENLVEIIRELENQKMIKSQKNKQVSFLMVLINFMKQSKKKYLKF